jgi:hypothetical protein
MQRPLLQILQRQPLRLLGGIAEEHPPLEFHGARGSATEGGSDSD